MIHTDSPTRTHSALRKTAKILFVASLVALLASCSAVFTASIDGRILDADAEAEGNTVGVANARVWLYTSASSRDADLNAWVDGDTSTLPSAASRDSYRYFLSTVSDDDGSFQFAGVIWETFQSEFGKTADRTQVWLLVWHPDYGLHPNPSPLHVVSDVSNQFEPFSIESIWSEATLRGTTSDWGNTDDPASPEPLANVPVQVRIPSSWTYSTEAVPADPEPVVADSAWDDPTLFTTTSDANGAWSLTVRFPRQPGHSDEVHKAIARVSWSLDGWRAGEPDPSASPVPANPGGLNTGVFQDADLDGNGLSAQEGDADDWYLETDSFGEDETIPTNNVVLQRYRFQASLAGEVLDTASGVGLNGVEIAVLVAGEERAVASSAAEDTASGTVAGRFDLGTITWTLDDIDVGVRPPSISEIRRMGTFVSAAHSLR